MPVTLDVFSQAQNDNDGYLLASTLDPANHDLFSAYVNGSSATSIVTDVRYATIYNKAISLTKAESHAWLDVYVALWRAGQQIVAAESGGRDSHWTKVHEAWKEVNNALILGYQKGGFEAWTTPCLYVVAKWLRQFAIRADWQKQQTKDDKVADLRQGLSEDVVDDSSGQEKLEDAARQINRIFSLCISDRSPIEESRKWGIYYITNLLFKTYFKLNQVNLCKNPLRSLQATAADMPPLSSFPKAHVVTFKYYVGVISFLEEDYAKAEEHLNEALRHLPRTASAQSTKNHELILTYLIPTKLLTSHRIPAQKILEPYPQLQTLFSPLARCIKRGDLAGFDRALEAGSAEFVKRRIYLTLERGRDIALRNLFRKVFVAGGFEPAKEGEQPIRRTRVPIKEFVAAVRLGLNDASTENKPTQDESGPPVYGLEEVERDEVECLIANLIYKNLMKGYISRAAEKAVLSKGGAFPGTGV